MKLGVNISESSPTDEKCAPIADIQVCFSFKHADDPRDGSNIFTRIFRECVSRTPRFTLVDDLNGEYDILFMNQLSRSPGSLYALSEIRAVLDGGREKKMVVRAINLECNYPHSDPIRNLRHFEQDRRVLDLLNLADFVIFQSAFQKSFFGRFGYKGKNHAIIHNGAASTFREVPGGAKNLGVRDDLILVSAAIATTSIKKQDIIARLSLVPGVRVIHSGVWPKNLDRGNVELAGILSHGEMARLYKRAHYFLHPAVHDICPNSLIEGLCAGLPTIYNPGPGSGSELGGQFGIALDENDLQATVARARKEYDRLATAIVANRHYYSIDRAALSYMNVFRTVAQREGRTTEQPLRVSDKSS